MSDIGGAGDAAFAGTAARLAGFAGAVLGWPPDAFWQATPAEVASVAAVLGERFEGGAAVPPDADTVRRLREAFPDG